MPFTPTMRTTLLRPLLRLPTAPTRPFSALRPIASSSSSSAAPSTIAAAAPSSTTPRTPIHHDGTEHFPTPDFVDWTTSYHGLSTQPFSKEIADILTRPLDPQLDVEMKPDGIIYMPEVRYRRVLNEAFGPGGWGLVPRGDVVVGDKLVTREYALIVHGRFISQAQGENNFFSVDQIPKAVEGCKSNALMRCCKDLGIAWQLWDPIFIRRFQANQAEQVWVEHVVSKKRARIWIKKGDSVPYPYKRTA